MKKTTTTTPVPAPENRPARCNGFMPGGVSVQTFQRESGETAHRLRGYAIVFGVESEPLYDDGEMEVREVIAPEAVTRTLLDALDIKMTMYHERELLLARSNKGKGSLTYGIDKRGVWFEFEAPDTANGREAVELVKRGDIAGCSFLFSTYYYNDAYVTRESVDRDGKRVDICTVRAITGIYDFTLASDPAYPDTEVEARGLRLATAGKDKEADRDKADRVKREVEEMRSRAAEDVFWT